MLGARRYMFQFSSPSCKAMDMLILNVQSGKLSASSPLVLVVTLVLMDMLEFRY
jgi:hypothetical protein